MLLKRFCITLFLFGFALPLFFFFIFFLIAFNIRSSGYFYTGMFSFRLQCSGTECAFCVCAEPSIKKSHVLVVPVSTINSFRIMLC